MVGRRVALLVATDRYQDTGLSRLTAPASDAEQLAAVLRDIRIAGFEVTTLYNEPRDVVGSAIGNFYRDRRSNDLTLLYFTGHGVKDEDGQLYLAMTNTDRENLRFTGVPSETIRAAMEGSRSRQKVLVLDCCYAGAFPVGLGIKGDPSVHALEQLGGRGCVVLTSSDAMQLSFEGNQVTETGPVSLRSGPSSLFTRFLIEGLRTGKADLDGDGDITLDELYSYVHDRVIDEQPLQRPKKKEDIEGGICVAQNIYWTVPSHISDAVNSPYPPTKFSALEELRRLYYRGNVIVKQRVLETVRLLAGDDSKTVSGAASQFLFELIPQEERRQAEQAAQREAERPPARSRGRAGRPARGRAGRPARGRAGRPARGREAARRQAEETAQREAEETAQREAEETAQREAEETARRQAEETARRQAEETAQREAEEAARRQAEEAARRHNAIQVAGRRLDEAAATVDPVPGSGPADGAHPSTITVWIRRHRLPAVALASAILAAVAVLPFVLTSPGKPASRTNSQGPTNSPSPTNPASPANSLTFSRTPTYIDLPSSYRALVTSLAFSPPYGATLAIAALNTCLWDFATAGCTTGHYTNASSVAFSPDGKIMAAGDGVNGNTYLWDVATQKLRATLPDPDSGGVNSVAFSHDGKTLAAGDVNGSTYIWNVANVATAKLITTLTDPGRKSVNSVAFSRDGKTVAAGGANGSTYLLNVATQSLITPLTDPGGKAVNSVAFSPDGNTVAAGDTNGITYLWNVAAAAASASSSAASTGWIRLGNLTTSPVDAYVYSSGDPSPQIVLPDLTYGTVSSYQVANAGNYTIKMRSAGSSASSTPVYTASVTVQAGRSYTAAALTVATGGGQATVLDDSLTTPAGKSLVRVIQASLSQKAVKFYCSCGGYITTNAAPGSISAYAPIPPGTWTMTATGHSAKGSLPVTLTTATVHTEIVLDTTGGGIQVVNLLDTAGPGAAKLIGTLSDVGGHGVNSVAFSPDGQTLAAGDANGSTYVWNVATAKPIATLKDPNSAGINAVAFSPDGKTLAIGDLNSSGRIYFWHISSHLSVVGVNAPLLDRHVTQFVSGRARERPDEIFRAADADGSGAGERRALADHVCAADSVPSAPAAAMPIVDTAGFGIVRVVFAQFHLYCKHSVSSPGDSPHHPDRERPDGGHRTIVRRARWGCRRIEISAASGGI